MTVQLVCLLLALVAFGLAAAQVAVRWVNLTALGLLLVTLALIQPVWPAVVH